VIYFFVRKSAQARMETLFSAVEFMAMNFSFFAGLDPRDINTFTQYHQHHLLPHSKIIRLSLGHELTQLL